ncbi:MAG TPA: hypothetical protein VND93_19815, partial [Myxococcales bacterium]|nr:hypothetical protein [Myxococcales bacterium]
TREMVDQNVFAVYDQALTLHTDQPDEESIMLYSRPAELLTDPSRAVGLNTRLSAKDKELIASVYPRPPRSPGA